MKAIVAAIVVVAPAADADARPCLPADAVVGKLVADDAAATLCYGDKTATCARVDLASGAWSAVAKPPADPAVPPPAFAINQDDRGVAVCRGETCTKLAAVPAPTKDSGPYLAAASGDGKRAVLAADAWKGARFFDVAANKQVAAVSLTAGGGCLDTVAVVGAFVYLATNVCAGPGAEGKVYSWRGKLVSSLDGVNPYGMSPVEVGGLYAVADVGGYAVAIIDGKTGASHTVSAPKVACDACSIGGGMPYSGALAATPSGKLVITNPYVVMVVDPVARKVERSFRFPVCAASGSGS